MATFTINEYGGVGQSMGGVIPVFSNHITDQTAITTSASSQQSAAFNDRTGIVNVTAVGGAVRIKFGADPTATATSHYLPDGESLQYYTEGGDKVAVIDA